jgi:SGNH domain (fused to AT3 domains)
MNAESRQLGIQTQFRISGACPPLLGAIPFKRDEGRFQCGHFNEKTAAEFIEMKTSGLRGVILSARWNSYLDLPVTEPGGTYPYGLALNWHSLEKADVGNIYVGTSPLDTNGSIHAMEISLRNSLATLTSAGLRVLVVAPVPELYFSGPQCLYKHSSETCTVPRTKVEQRRGHALQVLRKVTKEFASVKLWDPIEAFCDSTTCYAERNGMSLYNDDNHISGKMSFTLREKMDAQLRWAAGLD